LTHIRSIPKGDGDEKRPGRERRDRAAAPSRQTRKGVSAAPLNTRRVFPGTFIIARYAGTFTSASRASASLCISCTGRRSRANCRAMRSIPLPALLAKCLNHELGRILGR
jgi:hypothetical protein